MENAKPPAYTELPQAPTRDPNHSPPAGAGRPAGAHTQARRQESSSQSLRRPSDSQRPPTHPRTQSTPAVTAPSGTRPRAASRPAEDPKPCSLRPPAPGQPSALIKVSCGHGEKVPKSVIFTRQTLCQCNWEDAINKFRQEFPNIKKKKAAKITIEGRFRLSDSPDLQWARIARDEFQSIVKLVEELQLQVE